MRRFVRWFLCCALLVALSLPPRLHAMAAGGAGHDAAAMAMAADGDDCHNAPAPTKHGASKDRDRPGEHHGPRDKGAYVACLIACAALPALVRLPDVLWHAGASERIAARTLPPTAGREPDMPLRPPISLS